MKEVATDPDFVVAATCIRYGFGSWDEVWRAPEAVRLAFYFHVAQAEGYNVNWSTGSVHRD